MTTTGTTVFGGTIFHMFNCPEFTAKSPEFPQFPLNKSPSDFGFKMPGVRISPLGPKTSDFGAKSDVFTLFSHPSEGCTIF